MSPIEGILAAVPTPFTADGESIDFENVKKQVERYVDAGLHGIVTTGTTGEFTTLTEEEFKAIIKAYVDAAAGRITVVAGVGSNSTKQAVTLVKYAEEVGADAVMVVPPFYDPLSFKALYRFYEDVCGAITIPLMYYNLPGATGVNLTAAQLRELSKIKGFDFMKDTSGNAKELADLLTNPIDGFTAFNGWDTLTFFAMSHGAKACVWGVASVVPKECVELWNAFNKEKDLEKARQLWKYLWEVSDFLEGVNYSAGIKKGHELIGYSAGPVRLPTLPLEQEDVEKFTAILEKRKFK